MTEHTDTPARLMTGCEIVKAGEASRAHHAWSPDPWTSKGAVPLPGRPFQFHPTAVGMRAVAELVAAQGVQAHAIVRPVIGLKADGGLRATQMATRGDASTTTGVLH